MEDQKREFLTRSNNDFWISILQFSPLSYTYAGSANKGELTRTSILDTGFQVEFGATTVGSSIECRQEPTHVKIGRCKR